MTETMQQRAGNRTRFVAWVRSFGVSKLARDLNTQRNTVHYWIAGRSGQYIAPSAAFMSRIIQLSTQTPYEYGPLTYDDMLSGTTGIRGQHGTGYASPRPAKEVRTA
jgi:hypothetical protein